MSKKAIVVLDVEQSLCNAPIANIDFLNFIKALNKYCVEYIRVVAMLQFLLDIKELQKT